VITTAVDSDYLGLVSPVDILVHKPQVKSKPTLEEGYEAHNNKQRI
jgi:hypothetical protein